MGLAAASVIGGAALAGCSGETKPAGDATKEAPKGEETKEAPKEEPKEGGAGGDVGVFTWWAEGSEKDGLAALEKLFSEKYPNDKFVNLAVAGGAGSNAKAKLAADLQNNNPPESFQGHAGAELMDYIDAEQIEPVNEIIDGLGGDSVFPKNLLELLTVGGDIYSVPSNVHRSNVVWANPEVLKKAELSTDAPKDLDAWMADMDKLKAAGVQTPLSVGTAAWTLVHLFESVLLSVLGTDDYNKLFTKGTSWDTDKVKTAVAKFAKLLTYANTGGADDWTPAVDMVIDGKAAYNVMGDWAVAQFNTKKKTYGTDYVAWPTPGTAGTFLFLADSFTLAKGCKNPDGAKDWLNLVGSAEGQKQFNIVKGSIPARTDVPDSDFPDYQKSAMKSFKEDKIASSIIHGAAANNAWNSEIGTAVSKFWTDKNEADLVAGLVAAADKNNK
ncbi:MAG: sugar ABC transporter substrate-binding protein [Actinomycetales bacterium]|nr:MAG: sugar ABC transporter substrate-binding protein [Actinomycetales bacterium]